MSAVYEMHHESGCKCILPQRCTRLSSLLSGMTPHSCVETMGKQAVAVVARASQAAQSRRRGTSNAKARAKAEAGRSRSKTARKCLVSRARVALAGRNRIRVADSLETATFAGRQATGQPTARKRGKCRQCLPKMTKCFSSSVEEEFRRVQVARRLFPCRETASPVTSERTDQGMPHTAPAFARQAECIFSAQS